MMGIGIGFLLFFLFFMLRKSKAPSAGHGPIEILNGGSHQDVSSSNLTLQKIFTLPPYFKSNPVVSTNNVCYQEDSDSASFYLKMGSLVFAIGSMIYTCLEMGVFVENQSCFSIVIGIEPCFFVIFVMLQLYFIFRSSQVWPSVFYQRSIKKTLPSVIFHAVFFLSIIFQYMKSYILLKHYCTIPSC